MKVTDTVRNVFYEGKIDDPADLSLIRNQMTEVYEKGWTIEMVIIKGDKNADSVLPSQAQADRRPEGG
jgi:hypothetical protein